MSFTLPFPQIPAGHHSKSPFDHPDLVKGVRKVVAVLGGAYQTLTELIEVDVKG